MPPDNCSLRLSMSSGFILTAMSRISAVLQSPRTSSILALSLSVCDTIGLIMDRLFSAPTEFA